VHWVCLFDEGIASSRKLEEVILKLLKAKNSTDMYIKHILKYLLKTPNSNSWPVKLLPCWNILFVFISAKK